MKNIVSLVVLGVCLLLWGANILVFHLIGLLNIKTIIATGVYYLLMCIFVARYFKKRLGKLKI